MIIVQLFALEEIPDSSITPIIFPFTIIYEDGQPLSYNVEVHTNPIQTT